MMNEVLQFDKQLGWMPAIPLPYYLWFGRCKCDCGAKFWTEENYETHYALTHIEALAAHNGDSK